MPSVLTRFTALQHGRDLVPPPAMAEQMAPPGSAAAVGALPGGAGGGRRASSEQPLQQMERLGFSCQSVGRRTSGLFGARAFEPAPEPGPADISTDSNVAQAQTAAAPPHRLQPEAPHIHRLPSG